MLSTNKIICWLAHTVIDWRNDMKTLYMCQFIYPEWAKLANWKQKCKFTVNSRLADTPLLRTFAITDKIQIPGRRGLTGNDSHCYGLLLLRSLNDVRGCPLQQVLTVGTELNFLEFVEKVYRKRSWYNLIRKWLEKFLIIHKKILSHLFITYCTDCTLYSLIFNLS